MGFWLLGELGTVGDWLKSQTEFGLLIFVGIFALTFRIFACSNRSSSQSTADSVKFGADAFISKPFDVEKLFTHCFKLGPIILE